MKPIQTIQGQECRECKGQGRRITEYNQPNDERKCLLIDI